MCESSSVRYIIENVVHPDVGILACSLGGTFEIELTNGESPLLVCLLSKISDTRSIGACNQMKPASLFGSDGAGCADRSSA
jgi:hypothetical protein